jgi:hypothetical protein
MRRDGRFAWHPLRVRAVRGTGHRCVVFTPWERALPSLQEGTRACRRFDRCFCSSTAAITVGPPLAMPTVVPIPTFNWHCWVTRGAASSSGTGSAVEEAWHWRRRRRNFLARSGRRAGCMVGGTEPSCWSTGSDEAKRVHNRGAVACSQRGGSPFGPLVSAKMGERL